MITEKGTPVGDKGSVKDSLMTDDVEVCLCQITNYVRRFRQARRFARNISTTKALSIFKMAPSCLDPRVH